MEAAKEKGLASANLLTLTCLVAWGGIEKSAARRATTHFYNSSYLLGTRWGTPKLGYGDPNSWHHTTGTWPPNCIIHRSLEHANLRP